MFRTPRSWRNIYPVLVHLSTAHWGVRPWTQDGVYGDWVHESLRGKPKYRGVQHDQCPKDWPWWRLVAFYYCSLNRSVDPLFGVHAPSTGRRLWVYTRWGALHADLFIDRRSDIDPRFGTLV